MQNPTTLTAHFGGIRQLGYVVADLDATLAEWRRKGIGPWTIMRNVCLNAVYRGAPSRPLIDIALAYSGDVQIELIQQRNAAPSPYRARIAAGRYGLHHIAFLCADIAGDVRRAEALGWQVVCDIRMVGSGRYVYLQSPGFGDDFHIEFLEASPVMRRIFAVGMAETASAPHAETLEFDLASWASKLKQGAWMCGLPLRRYGVGSAPPVRHLPGESDLKEAPSPPLGERVGERGGRPPEHGPTPPLPGPLIPQLANRLGRKNTPAKSLVIPRFRGRGDVSNMTERPHSQLDRIEYTVPDLSAAIDAWQTQLGIGPWQRVVGSGSNRAEARSGAVVLSLVESASQPSRGSH